MDFEKQLSCLFCVKDLVVPQSQYSFTLEAETYQPCCRRINIVN